MGPARHARSRYIPALDGIRALAVVAVIIYHLNPSLAPGGMQGVTVFFVLSGYLITSLLLVEFRDSGRIDFKRFWQRRLRRLVPAVLTVIIVTAALCTGFNHVMLTKMRPDIIPSALFINNWWQIFNHQSYFSAVGDPSPLTHFWSLAIEMQFYLVWPVALLAVLRRRLSRKRIALAVLIVSAASALEMAMLYNPASDPSRVYYGTDTRAFSLLLGAFLALLPQADLTGSALKLISATPLPGIKRPSGGERWTADSSGGEGATALPVFASDVIGLVGLVGMLLLMAFTDGYSAFPYRGGILIASLCALMLVSACVQPGSLVAEAFSCRPLVWIGKRSYSIYLWHYPLLLLLNPAHDVTSKPWWAYALQVALVIAVSETCYRFIETPFRHGAFGSFLRRLRDDRSISLASIKRHAILVALMGAFGIVALGGIVLVPETSALSEEGAAALAGTTGDDGREGGSAGKSPSTIPEGAYDITLIGDSVSLRSVDAFMQTFPYGYIDAAVSRQFSAGIDVYRDLVDQGRAGRIAVFALGTNGPVTAGDIDELMGLAGEDRIVVFVNNRAARPWCEPNNRVFADAAERYRNVRVIDWFTASADKNELFDGDGIHLSSEGVEKYVSLIDDEVRSFLPVHPEDENDPRLAAVQHVLDSLKSACTPKLTPVTPEKG